jgi:dimethylargininase
MANALVRPPGPRLANGITTHIERRPVDVELARAQWAAYVAALESAGWNTVEIAPADGCPDAVFVEDALVVSNGLAVVTRPGAEARRAELETAEAAVRALGFPVARIEQPGTLDGGDVLIVGGTTYVGTGGRTNSEGARRLGRLLGTTVVEVPVAGVLHLKTAVTALPDGTIVGHLPPAVAFPAFRPVPEESGAHVVVLDERHILIAADCPRSAELFASLGYEPVVVDIGEFQKLEGCVTCLSVLL